METTPTGNSNTPNQPATNGPKGEELLKKAEQEASTAASPKQVQKLQSFDLSPEHQKPIPVPVPAPAPAASAANLAAEHDDKLNKANQKSTQDARRPYRKTRRKNTWALTLFSLLVVAIFVLIITGMYLFFYEPRIALSDYISKIVEVKTGKVTGSLSFKEDDRPIELNNVTTGNIAQIASAVVGKSTFNFTLLYNMRDSKNPKANMELGINSIGVTTHISTTVIDQTLNFKMADNPLFAKAGLKVEPDWHELSIPDNIYREITCTLGDQEHSIVSRNVLHFMPVKNFKRLGLYETVEGHRVVHTTGELNTDKILEALEQANQGLPDNCRIGLSKEQLGGVTAFYDLYTSNNFDRLTISINDAKIRRTTVFSMDSTDYGTDVKIEHPQATSIHSIFDVFRFN